MTSLDILFSQPIRCRHKSPICCFDTTLLDKSCSLWNILLGPGGAAHLADLLKTIPEKIRRRRALATPIGQTEFPQIFGSDLSAQKRSIKSDTIKGHDSDTREFRCEFGRNSNHKSHSLVRDSMREARDLTIIKWNSEAADAAGARHYCGGSPCPGLHQPMGLSRHVRRRSRTF